MKQGLTTLAVGLLLASSTTLAAQGTTQKDRAAAMTKGAEVQLVGCLEYETDYRARMNTGKGGVLGTGVGAGNEYVLSNAAVAPPGATAPKPTGTSGSSGSDYMLTGTVEENMKREVGRQVHIIGTVDQVGSGSELSRISVSAFHPMMDYCPATARK